MIMGYFVQRVQYPRSQYFEALLISAGVAIFSVHGDPSSSGKDDNGDDDSGLIGLAILLMFITSDSFTSQWQSRLYNTYGRQNVDSYQMMLGVNVSALFLTTTALLVSGDLPAIVEFMSWNPEAMRSVLILSVASTFGQICIFYTIKEFGPIVFTIIMTTRQMFSIFLSAAAFGHRFSAEAVIGGVIVFGVLFYQICRKCQARRQSHYMEYATNETEDEKVSSTGLLSTLPQDPK
jgi:adenosine 3'-phospho 5'-phosphosulfate transporter B2